MPNSRYDELMKTKPYLPFRLNFLTDAMVAQAEKDLGETDAIRQPCIDELRKLIQKDPKINCPADDAYLLQYLRARKFNVKKAFDLLMNFYRVKKAYPDLFDHCEVEDLKKVFKTGALVTLPYRDSEGCAIYLVQINKWDPDVHSMRTAVSGLTCCILMCIEDCATQICGVRILFDCHGASLKQIRCVTPRYLSLFSKALRNCLPVRFKGIHIYNESTIFQYLWSLFKLFLTEKINKRVHFHGDNQKNLHKCIPKAILPTDFGGDNPSQNVLDWFLPEIDNYFERYSEIHTYGLKD